MVSVLITPALAMNPTSKPINCLDPRVIINPRFIPAVRQVGYYHCLGTLADCEAVRVYSDTSPAHLLQVCRITRNSVYKSLYKDGENGLRVFNDEPLKYSPYVVLNGVVIYAVMVVPCNHCDLCVDRRDRDFQARVRFESSMYNEPPCFITLTYNDEHLPKDGVCKADVQKFLKRLRIDVNKIAPCTLRYVCSAEYGSEKFTARPHYHLLLWGLPPLTDYERVHLIHSAWSIKTFHPAVNGNKSYITYDHLGIIHCPLARDFSGAYVIKYSFKHKKPPKGQNECFILSSRRPAIGGTYVDVNRAWLMQKVFEPMLEVLNPFDGTTTKVGFPAYFKARLLPCFSQHFNHVCGKDFSLDIKELHYYAERYDEDLAAQLDDLFPYYNFHLWRKREIKKPDGSSYHPPRYDNVLECPDPYGRFLDLLDWFNDVFINKNLDYEIEYHQGIQGYKDCRTLVVQNFLSTASVVNLNDAADKVRSKWNKRENHLKL